MAELTEKEINNELRCYASEIILKLFKAGELSQVRLLKILIDESLKKLEAEGHKKNGGNGGN